MRQTYEPWLITVCIYYIISHAKYFNQSFTAPEAIKVTKLGIIPSVNLPIQWM